MAREIRRAIPVLSTDDPTAVDPELLGVDVSIEVDDVDRAFREAHEAGLEIVGGIRNEPWGIRRFFVCDPGGRTVNVASHLPAPPSAAPR